MILHGANKLVITGACALFALSATAFSSDRAAASRTAPLEYAELRSASIGDPPQLDNELACVTYWLESPYRNYGYDHIVSLSNRCADSVQCRIKTNVNPDPMLVDVEGRTTEHVVTYRGSPSQQFVASVSCDDLQKTDASR